jgi:hypothetical protein
MLFMLLSVIAAAMLGNVWIKKDASEGKQRGVLDGMYLLALVKACFPQDVSIISANNIPGSYPSPAEEKR